LPLYPRAQRFSEFGPQKHDFRLVRREAKVEKDISA
jgi:hypothetical protein